MATSNKTLQTRIQLKYDTLANWEASTKVLLAGELAIAYIDSKANTKPDGKMDPPQLLMKVGDGEHTFSQLKFVSGLAADVYEWAKATTKPSYSATEIGGIEAYVKEQAGTVDTDTQYQLVATDDTNHKYELQSKSKGDSSWTKVSDLDLSGIVSRLSSAETDIDNLQIAVNRLDGTVDVEGSVKKQINDAVNAAVGALDSEESQTAGADGLALNITQVDGKITSISGSIAAETYDAYGAADAVNTALNTYKTNNDKAVQEAAAAAAKAQKAADDEANARKAAIEALDYTSYAAGDAEGTTISFVGTVSEENGVISATKRDLTFTDAYSASNPAATKKYVDDAVQTGVADLAGAMHFEGKYDTLPAVANFQKGDVIIVGIKEYVLSEQDGTKAWIELGDEGAIGAAIAGISADKSQVAGSDNGHVNASLKQVNGAVTEFSVSIPAETYDAYGSASSVEGKFNAYKTTNDAAVKAAKDLADANEDAITKLNGGAEVAGSVANSIDNVIKGLDATVSQAAGADGLALSITEVDGVITAISGSIAANKYDAYGAAAAVQGDTTKTVKEVEALANAAKQAADKEAADRKAAIEALDGSATASAASNGTVNVLTSVVETDGVISKGGEVNISKVGQTGKVQDLIQDNDTYIVFNCGSASVNI